MKSIFIGTASTAAITLLSWSTILTNPAAAGEPSNNLLRNSSLEGTETPFTDTSWNSGSESEDVEYVWEVGTDGKNSYLKIAKEKGSDFPTASWEQTFAYSTTAPALTVTANVKAVKVTKAAVDAIFIDANGGVVRHKWIALIGPKNEGDTPLDHDWKEYSGTIAIPPACRKIKIALQNYGPGTVMFDDITAVYENDSSKIKNALAAVATEVDHSNSNAGPSSNQIVSNQIATKEAPASAQFAYNDSNGNSTRPAVSSYNYSTTNSIRPSFAQPPAYVAVNPPYPVVGVAPQSIVTPIPATQRNMEVDAVEIFYNPIAHARRVGGETVADIDENAGYRTSDGKQFKSEEAAKSHARTLKLTKQYHEETDPVAKAQLREDLVAAVTTEYDHMRADRVKEIEELTKKLEAAKANLDKRDAVKDKIIEKRVEQLLGVDQLYQWDSSSQEPFVTVAPQHGTFNAVTPFSYQPFSPATTPGR